MDDIISVRAEAADRGSRLDKFLIRGSSGSFTLKNSEALGGGTDPEGRIRLPRAVKNCGGRSIF